MGNQEGMEAGLVRRAEVPFTGIPAGAVHGVGLRRTIGGAWRTLLGIASAWSVIGRFRPDVALLTGGFVGVPVSIAAWLRRVPTVVFLPDIEPGLALKVMARLAWKVAATTAASADYVSAAKLVVTGYPLREQFLETTRERARERLGIPASESVVLVYGGSKGARSINRAIVAALPRLLRQAIIIHVSGEVDWAEVDAARRSLSDNDQKRYRVYAYLHEEMVDAMASADLVICRSGASSLGELPALGLPAILIPYPHAWRYQKVNADHLAGCGAAVVLADGDLADGESGLAAQVEALLKNPDGLERMRVASRGQARRDGADNIAILLAKAAERNYD